jgi:hypothetical protein
VVHEAPAPPRPARGAGSLLRSYAREEDATRASSTSTCAAAGSRRGLPSGSRGVPPLPRRTTCCCSSTTSRCLAGRLLRGRWPRASATPRRARCCAGCCATRPATSACTASCSPGHIARLARSRAARRLRCWRWRFARCRLVTSWYQARQAAPILGDAGATAAAGRSCLKLRADLPVLFGPRDFARRARWAGWLESARVTRRRVRVVVNPSARSGRGPARPARPRARRAPPASPSSGWSAARPHTCAIW